MVIGDIVAKLRGRRRLQPKIRLQFHRAGERVDDFDGAQPPPFRGKALGDSRDHIHIGEIARELPLDAGPQHLHRDLAFALVVAGVGDMHLRHRGRRDRLAEGRKHLVDAFAERLFDDLDRRLATERLHAVLQGGQRIGDFAADDIGPRRQELPELHIGRADLREGAHQRLRAAADILARDEIGEPHRQPRRRRQQLGIEPGEHALAREDIAGARQSQKMPEA